MFSALRAKGRFVPTCAAVLTAALLAGCGDPDAGLPMRPAGYWGTTQLLEEQATGCLYVVNSKNREVEAPAPILRPDGSHMGCKPTTDGEGSSVGMSRQANAPKASPGEQGEEG